MGGEGKERKKGEGKKWGRHSISCLWAPRLSYATASSVVTVAVSCAVFEIKRDIG